MQQQWRRVINLKSTAERERERFRQIDCDAYFVFLFESAAAGKKLLHSNAGFWEIKIIEADLVARFLACLLD